MQSSHDAPYPDLDVPPNHGLRPPNQTFTFSVGHSGVGGELYYFPNMHIARGMAAAIILGSSDPKYSGEIRKMNGPQLVSFMVALGASDVYPARYGQYPPYNYQWAWVDQEFAEKGRKFLEYPQVVERLQLACLIGLVRPRNDSGALSKRIAAAASALSGTTVRDITTTDTTLSAFMKFWGHVGARIVAAVGYAQPSVFSWFFRSDHLPGFKRMVEDLIILQSHSWLKFLFNFSDSHLVRTRLFLDHSQVAAQYSRVQEALARLRERYNVTTNQELARKAAIDPTVFSDLPRSKYPQLAQAMAIAEGVLSGGATIEFHALVSGMPDTVKRELATSLSINVTGAKSTGVDAAAAAYRAAGVDFDPRGDPIPNQQSNPQYDPAMCPLPTQYAPPAPTTPLFSSLPAPGIVPTLPQNPYPVQNPTMYGVASQVAPGPPYNYQPYMIQAPPAPQQGYQPPGPPPTDPYQAAIQMILAAQAAARR